MKVDVLRSTDNPERLVCQAARGDYFEGYVGDTKYAELMENVDYDEERDVDRLKKADAMTDEVLEAKTKIFIEKELRRGHYGPFEHPQITFSVKGVSRVTMAQITRHRHLTFDVQSMRYADFSEQEISTPKSLTDEDHFTRETGLVELAEEMDDLRQLYEDNVERSLDTYKELVENGVPKEDARFILPLGTTVNMTLSGNTRTFLHLLDMRKKGDAQWQIRELSERLLRRLAKWMPYTFNWYNENGPNKISP